jgi:hypothetical protein
MRIFQVVLLMLFSANSFACTCFETNKHSAQDLVFSSFVFEGTIVSAKTVFPDSSDSMIKATFRVERWLSPKSGNDTISVYSPVNSCGLEFSTGQSWLIFSSPFYRRLTSYYCDRSVLINNNPKAPAILHQFRELAAGDHDINIKLEIYSGVYPLVGRIEDGEPVGTWLKLRGTDTLAFYNFASGTQLGMQMETDDDVFPPERCYYKIERAEKDILKFSLYDQHRNLVVECEYRNGPFRIRHQSPYSFTAMFNLWNNFKYGKCDKIAEGEK